jgi:NH3-dependent NAD+ synthetase
MTATEPSAESLPPFDLPTELAIDTDIARRVIGEFIRGQLEQAGFERAVLGLSGGIDSAVVAYLVAEAIGPERLLAVMMPYRTSSPASRSDAESVVAALGCASEVVDISPMVDGYFGTEATRGASEPDGLAVPEPIVRKPPTADLWPGQTDEIEGGFSYPVLDRLLYWRVDKRRSLEEMAELGYEPAVVERVDRLVAGSEFKRQVPPIAKLGPRTAGVDYLYPRRRPGSARG